VCPFSLDYEPVALPVVDVAVQYLPYPCQPSSGKEI
jgi:hypothetical protein